MAKIMRGDFGAAAALNGKAMHPSSNGNGIQAHTTTTEIHTLAARMELWQILSQIARATSHEPSSGIGQLRHAARDHAERLEIDPATVPVSSIWLNSTLQVRTMGANWISEVLAIEQPILRSMVDLGFTLAFVGGPITSFGMEHKMDHWQTLENRKRALAYREPDVAHFSTTYFHIELEDRLSVNHGQKGFEDAQRQFVEYHNVQLASGVRKFKLTGPWRMSSGSKAEHAQAQRLGLEISYHDDEELRRVAVGHAQAILRE